MRLIYLSPVPWASFSQRPHHFIKWFHNRTGGKVLWVDPYPTRLPKLADLLRKRPKEILNDSYIPNWLEVLKPRALPIEPLPYVGKVNRLFWGSLLDKILKFVAQEQCQIGIGKPSELALMLLASVPYRFSFYDAMDDFPAFYLGLSRLAMARREYKISNIVHKIMVSSSRLYERFYSQGKKVMLSTNACASDSLPPITAMPRRSNIESVLGYVGTIGNWFDWPLVIALARQNPKINIRLIGPVYISSPEVLPDNIELLPPCSHKDAIQAMLQFSVGLIPFKKNDLTASVDPIKYYEYRALGLPVISTSFGEMIYRNNEPGLFFMDETKDLNYMVKTALAYQYEINEVKDFRDANCWEARFDASGILF